MSKTNKHNPQGCAGCVYQSKGQGWCNFADIAGVTRHSLNAPLFENGGCRLKKTRHTSVEEARRRWNPYPWKHKSTDEKDDIQVATDTKPVQPVVDYEELRRLYRDGLSDERIAVKASVNVKTVRKWRKRNGLESNYILEMRNARNHLFLDTESK